jgi:hypothetical protein
MEGGAAWRAASVPFWRTAGVAGRLRAYFDSNALIVAVTCGMTSLGTAIESW